MTAEDRWMERLAQARRNRDERMKEAQQDFGAVVYTAHRAGLSYRSIHAATGLSMETLKSIVRRHEMVGYD